MAFLILLCLYFFGSFHLPFLFMHKQYLWLFSNILHCQGGVQHEYQTRSTVYHQKKCPQITKLKFWKLTFLLLKKKFYETCTINAINYAIKSKQTNAINF